MKIIGIEDEEEIIKKINKKRITITAIVSIFILVLIIIIAVYMGNKEFRQFVDKYILMKNVIENNLPTIEINENESNYIYAYDKYISIFSKNTLTGYNKSGKKEYELNLEITTPIIDTNNKFLLIGEKNKQKLYLISGSELIWEKDLEGNISRISVNKNGYISVILSGTSHKSVIQTFDSTGKELFKTYLSNSIAVDSEISFDNKYLSFAEVSTNGTIAKTIIKTISIQKAKENPSESIIYMVEAPNNSIALNLKYQDGNKLVCMYDDSIHIIQNENSTEILKLNEDNKKINFSEIELNNYVMRVIEKSSILNTESSVEIINVQNNRTNIYTIDSSVREIYTYDGNIALNVGSEVHFIGTNGWLNKKYTSSQEVRNIVMNKSFAGIVYRNKIEIIDL